MNVLASVGVSFIQEWSCWYHVHWSMLSLLSHTFWCEGNFCFFLSNPRPSMASTFCVCNSFPVWSAMWVPNAVIYLRCWITVPLMPVGSNYVDKFWSESLYFCLKRKSIDRNVESCCPVMHSARDCLFNDAFLVRGIDFHVRRLRKGNGHNSLGIPTQIQARTIKITCETTY